MIKIVVFGIIIIGDTMKNKIEIYINNEEDLLEKYNHKLVSQELIDYIISKSKNYFKEDDIVLVVENKTKYNDENVEKLIKNGLKFELQNSTKIKDLNNIKQIILVLIGILFLFLSTLINDAIFGEVLIVIGWFPIWEALDIEFFTDVKEKRKRSIINKLLESKIEFKK